MNRISEPSTWAGLAAFGQMFAGMLPPQYAWAGHLVTAMGGALAVALNERAKAA